MIRKIIESNKIFAKIASIGFVTTFTRALINLIISKVLAVHLGPSGMAIYGQLINYSALLTNISTGSTTTGIVKLSAENKDNRLYLDRLFSTVFKINLYLGGLVFVFFCVFVTPLSVLIFGDESYRSVIFMMGLSAFFFGVNLVIPSILNGLGHFRQFFYYNIVLNFALLTCIVVLVNFLGVKGALQAYLLSQIITFFLMIWQTYKVGAINIKYFMDKVFDKKIVKSLASFTIMSFTAVLLVNFSQIIIRNNVINAFSQEKAGLWEGMLKISSAYFNILVSSLSIYYLPKIASFNQRSLFVKEFVYLFKIIAPCMLLLFTCIFLFRVPIINTLFTEQFLPIENYFLPVLIGDFFKWIGWLFSYILIAKSALNLYLLNEIMAFCIFIGLTYFGSSFLGEIGLYYGYATTYFLYMITSAFLCNVYLSKLK